MAALDFKIPVTREVPSTQGEVHVGRFGRLSERLQCPIDEDAIYHNDRWTNRDWIPIPKDRRTWGVNAYNFYWVVSGICLSGWTVVSL